MRNETTDRVLSQYFTRGRGRDGWEGVANDSGHPWMIASADISGILGTTGVVHTRIASTLQQIAVSDGQMLFYCHPGLENLASLEAVVVLARSLGIQIVRPSDLLGSTLVTPDPFILDTADLNAWVLDAPYWSVSSDYGLRGGQSLKFTPNAPGGGYASGSARRTVFLPHMAQAGLFSVYRASMRYKATGDLTISSGAWGLSHLTVAARRDVAGGNQVIGNVQEFGTRFPGTSTIPAADWARISQILVFGPDVSQFNQHWLGLANVAEGSPPIYFSDIRLDRLSTAPAMTYTATLNGTTGVVIKSSIYDVGRYGIAVTPLASPAGRIYATTDQDQITIKSTDAGDTSQSVRVTVTPATGYANLTLSELGG